MPALFAAFAAICRCFDATLYAMPSDIFAAVFAARQRDNTEASRHFSSATGDTKAETDE